MWCYISRKIGATMKDLIILIVIIVVSVVVVRASVQAFDIIRNNLSM